MSRTVSGDLIDLTDRFTLEEWQQKLGENGAVEGIGIVKGRVIVRGILLREALG